MPVTFWSMTVGFAALAGLPPASGFFSKDAILSQAWHTAQRHGASGWFAYAPLNTDHPTQRLTSAQVPDIPAWTGWLVLVVGLITAAVTAAYAARTWLVTFFGERRSPAEVREAPGLMRWPVAALAVPALILGFFGLGSDHLRPELGMAVVSLLFVLAGAGGVFLVWNRDPALDPVRLLGPARPLLLDGFRVDAVYDVLVVRPVLALARLVVQADERVVDAAVEGTGRGARGLGGLLRRTENGNPQTYISGVLAGVVIIVLAVVVLT
jgi:NADH-quinone oxidoreductase subunit L